MFGNDNIGTKRILPALLIPAAGYLAFDIGGGTLYNSLGTSETEAVVGGMLTAGLAMGATHLAYRAQDNSRRFGGTNAIRNGLKDAAIVGTVGTVGAGVLGWGLVNLLQNDVIGPLTMEQEIAILSSPAAIAAASLGAYNGGKK